MGLGATFSCIVLSLLVAGSLGARDHPNALGSRVIEPFIVNGESPMSHVYFYDEKFAGYDVECVVPDGSPSLSFNVTTRADPPGSATNVVVYGISTPVVGKYTCEFAKSRGGGSKRAVDIVVREPNTVPTAPALAVLEGVYNGETIVYFPVVDAATGYDVHCRTPERDDVPTYLGGMGNGTTSFVTVSVETTKPGRYGCVVYAKNDAGLDGMQSYAEFDVTA